MLPFEHLHALAVAEDCVPLLAPLLLTGFHLPWKRREWNEMIVVMGHSLWVENSFGSFPHSLLRLLSTYSIRFVGSRMNKKTDGFV